MQISIQLINLLLQQADIEGLIQLGAPGDEYSSEAEAISLALAELNNREVNAENIAALVSEIWRESFNLATSDLEARHSAINGFVQQLIQNQSMA